MSTPIGHSHVFLGPGHEGKERKIWMVIGLSFAMMVAEIIGGIAFGSLALLADGLHMGTHVAALAIAALAYNYARRHANDPRFAFGTGKLGDLAGFTSAIILGVATLAIGYEAMERFFNPIVIDIDQAILVAVIGLMVNIVSAWMLSGEDHHHHGHGHDHGHKQDHPAAVRRLDTGHGVLLLELFEDGVPARFRLRFQGNRGFQPVPGGESVTLELERPDGAREHLTLRQYDGFLESQQIVDEPHEFTVRVRLPHDDHSHDLTAAFAEQARHEHHGHDVHDHHEHDHAEDDGGHAHHRDNNYRAAFVHVLADAGVSVLAIAGLLLAKYLGWTFMDPIMGIVGALVIANWSYGLIKDSGGILLDMTADRTLAAQLRKAVESEGDHVTDLHLWRLGPGHLGAIVSVVSDRPRAAEYYRCRFGRFAMLSHVTIEARPR
jgi:cation diffusion facilitator family transporter